MRQLAAARSTVGVYTRRTGSDELLADVLESATDDSMRYREVDPAGTFTSEVIDVGNDEIIRLDWDTDYLRALRALVEFAPPPDH